MEPSATPQSTETQERLLAGRTLLLLIPLVLLTAPIFWLQTRAPEAPVSQAVWGLVVLSALANVIVIAYHYLLPAHPKFLMVPWRRFILRVHILSGTVELVSGLIACFTGNTTAALIMGAAGLFFHVPSAFLQTPIVFGSKAIMVPSYLICILTHAFCAGMLLVRPASTQWAVNTFLVFNVYVWCRIYYYLFDMLKLFGGVKYSIAILAAGATMIPALFGAMGIILLGTFIGAFILLYRLIFIRTPAEYLDFVREKARDSATGNSHLQLSGGRGLASGESDRLARSCFDRLARGISGRLERVAVIQCLAPWGLPAPAIEAYADRLLTAGPLDFPVFQRELWSIGAVRQHLVASHYIEQAGTDREKAELVFRHLDADGDGAVDAADIDLLLLEWGLPHSETRRYLARCRADASGRINFGEFLRSMEPVWRYIYHEVFRAEYAERTTEMIGRSAKAVLETRHTGRLRERVKRELLSRVPFLAGGGEELIADLAASLVTERHAVGGVICREGEPGENFHLIASGLVRVSKHGEALTDLGPGGCLGEGSLLTDLPRSATATVLQDTVLFSLTRAAFNYLTETYPHIRAQLRALHDDRRIGTNTRSLEQQLASHLPFLGCQPDPSLVADLARQLVPAFCRQGEYLLREGEPGDRFYIVEHGTLQVSCGGEILATLGTGACLGEGSLLEPGLRRASAKALADCTLLALDRQVFQEILAKYPAVRSSIADLHQRRTNPRLPVSHSHPSA